MLTASALRVRGVSVRSVRLITALTAFESELDTSPKCKSLVQASPKRVMFTAKKGEAENPKIT
jgi:hypothetical protein